MADVSKLYKQKTQADETGEEEGWTHFKTGKPLQTKRGDHRTMDGKEYEAIGHLHENPEKWNRYPDEEVPGPAGAGTLRGQPFDRHDNGGVLWREVKTKPTS